MALEYLKPGMAFLDVGAHVGYFTILAGWLVSEYGIKMTFWYSAIVTLLAAALLIPVRFKHPDTQRNIP